MILVDPGVYIGTAADLNDSRTLVDAAVTHILSVDSVDPASLLPPDSGFRRKWVNVLDEGTSDLLSHMDDTFLFIQEAVDGGGAALVHCQAGRSRSATVVTAFLMKTHQLSFLEAHRRLRAVKPDVQVNSGFEEQLCLYELMRWEVDTSSSLFKQYRLTKMSEKYPELQQVPRELFASDPDHSTSSEVSYRCRKCRFSTGCWSPVPGPVVQSQHRTLLPPQSDCLSGSHWPSPLQTEAVPRLQYSQSPSRRGSISLWSQEAQ
ncbi:dual specificity protein phosphatase 12 isoform 2-T2 [Aulostomus maculatus]